jgi:hypothetical protein
MDEALDADLPPPETRRWVPSRKAAVVLAIRKRTLTVWNACERYNLSADELAQWERDFDQYGAPGLRTTRLQIYRKTSEPK